MGVLTDVLVHETSTSTGTGNFTTSAVSGKQRLSDWVATGATTNVFDYFISNRSAAEWEYGTGHMSAVGTLVRDTVKHSSNANALVSFSAGTKDVTSDWAGANVQIFTASGTWTKPAIGTFALIRAWGGGGSGGRAGAGDGGGGGGGGGYWERVLLLSAMGATETITIGAGGVARTVDETDGATGGDTLVGALGAARAGGGGQGATADGGGGGGGGGLDSSGAIGAAGVGGQGGRAYLGGAPLTFAAGGTYAATGGGGNYALYPYGGGGGGGGGSGGAGGSGGSGGCGGGGGGGGGGTGASTAGTSKFGGDGGIGSTSTTAAANGVQPGGGGGGSSAGNSGAGGAGRAEIYVF